MKVEVTQEDIDQGHRLDCVSCPIALAMQRAVGPDRAGGVVVGVLYTSVGITECYRLPHAALVFICDFDNRQPVSPFTFELEGL